MSEAEAIAKTMDRSDLDRPECREIVDELCGLMRRMRRGGVSYSSWYGTLEGWPSVWEWVNRGADYAPWPGNPDELRVPWFLLWEIAWLVSRTPMRAGGRVLDLGGAGSLMSCYLASRGHEVVAIDLDERLVSQTGRIGKAMGWRLSGERMDMRAMRFGAGRFDHVVSVSVLEHLSVEGRVASCGQLRGLLRDSGTASLTFDYGNPQVVAALETPDDVESQIVGPSGMVQVGRPGFVDNGLRYLEAPAYFGFGRVHAWAGRTAAWLRGTLRRGGFSDRRRRYTFGAVVLRAP